MSTILRHKPKPKKKRLEPRPLVEAERDACDLVGAVLSLVLNAHASRLGLQEKLRAETHGRDPLAQLRAAIGRGARMDELVKPPPLFGDGDDTPSTDPLPVRQAAESVAAELGDKPNANQIRGRWRRARKQ